LVAPANVFTRAMVNINPAFALNLRAMWEAANNRWNQWVLNYSQSRQLDLLRNLGFESPSWQDLSTVLIALVVLASTVGAGWTLWDRHRQDPWLRLYRKAERKFRQTGLHLPPNTPPRQMALRLAAHAGTSPHTAALREWLLQLEAWRYQKSSGASTAELRSLQREFSLLRWPKQTQPGTQGAVASV
jgi:hypothetical protein